MTTAMKEQRDVRRTAEALVPADLASIGLAELNARASMLSRVDRKYILHADEVPEIVSGLDAETRVLDIDGIRAQAYESTYFDTAGLDAFMMTARPRRRRFKVRTRTYLDSDLAFLEVKTRGVRGFTMKERIRYDLGDAANATLTDEGRIWVSTLLGAIGYERSVAEDLRPVLRGSYSRLTLAMPDGGRATLDSGLAWTDLRPRAERPRFAESHARLEAPDLVIIETKSGSSPSQFDHLLWSVGHRPSRISKYATALSALDPDLPTNRWNRTLRTYFGLDG